MGKGGKMIKVYKLRTMYPYAEYLQDYVHQKNSLENGGNLKMISALPVPEPFLRRLWLDELPMLVNLFRGDLKLVGVRPISQHYFDLYSKELQEKRIKYRPGLVPPYYADLPETLEEIQESEMRYLESYEKRPLRTQWRYFWKAFAQHCIQKGAFGLDSRSTCPTPHSPYSGISLSSSKSFDEMILLTGGTGLLGSHLLYELVRNHEEVVALKRPSSRAGRGEAGVWLLYRRDGGIVPAHRLGGCRPYEPGGSGTGP